MYPVMSLIGESVFNFFLYINAIMNGFLVTGENTNRIVILKSVIINNSPDLPSSKCCMEKKNA